MKITVLNPFTIDPVEHSKQHSIEFLDESLTTQADVEASDINTIVRVFGVTGELPYGNYTPFSADVTDLPMDYKEALSFIQEANESFMELPSNQRTRFKNDAGNFLEFIQDPANYQEAAELGFVPKLPPTDGLPDPKTVETSPTATPGGTAAAHSST